MPFGFTNAPASFQNLVNDILQDLLYVYVLAYLDDIMVFPKSEEEHVTHVSTVPSRLRANNLLAKASEFLFDVSIVEYLGYVVPCEGLKMDQTKVQQILNWPPPRNLKALQSFLGFANFYHRFIKNYSKKIVSPTQRGFHHGSNPSLPTIVETNASNYDLGAVLSHVSDSGKHPIALNSHNLTPGQLNYEIHDKELLGIVWALKRWRAFLLSLSSPFEVLTNHSSLQYFMSLKVFTHRQAHWAEFLSEFHFSITVRPRRLATLLDALSHWDNVYLKKGEDFISKNPMNFQQLIKQDEVHPSRYFAVKVESFSNFIDSIQKALWHNSQYRSILQELGKDWVVVPNDPKIQLSILQKSHDSPLAGHSGQEKTLKPVKRDFHWSGMTQFIKDYVSSCQQCSRNTNIHHKKFGLLKPLPIPNGPWICLSMDFITQLPLSNSVESILVIVDRFSKMACFILTISSITSLDLAHLLIKNIFVKHGLPSSITWRVNHILEQYLWMYVSYYQDDWNTWLPLAELAYNNSDHSSTKKLLFFAVYGRDPQFDSVHITQDTPSGKLSTKFQSVQQDVKRELEVAISRCKSYAYKSRASPPVFNPGDMVWLSSENIKSTRPAKRLSERWLGPFPILKKFSTHAYPLKLPCQWKSIHPVFHISLLEPVKTSTSPNRHQGPPPPINIEEEEEWEVSQTLDSKLKRRKLWYLVEWKCFSQDSERSTWKPAENLNNCPQFVKDFHSMYPDKPGPNSSKA
ncbi:hypothetical protein O181_082482 [Austropuccinia psidii MF-1]|uniref:Chromo domain-containing protein n=1 Tax=Austropuccinia psidii MF-1 TaxID=1389203 RepID=A0A9Q3FQI1_9BASI|nr:hypothetical protein [Austropuccinia psidii MF-1]